MLCSAWVLCGFSEFLVLLGHARLRPYSYTAVEYLQRIVPPLEIIEADGQLPRDQACQRLCMNLGTIPDATKDLQHLRCIRKSHEVARCSNAEYSLHERVTVIRQPGEWASFPDNDNST